MTATIDFRDKLLALQVEIERISEIDQAGTSTVELDQTRVGRLSRMDAMQSQQMNLESKRRRQLELTRIKRALKRIEDDDYGDCAECGESINPKRLEVDPAADYCIQCADKFGK